MDSNQASGLAAIALCESLLLALTDNNLLSQEEVGNILDDAEQALRQASQASKDDNTAKSAADVLLRISQGRNAIPRPTGGWTPPK